MRQNLTVAGLTLLAIFLMGNPGCDGGTTEDGDTETPTAEPEAVADVVLGGLELARTSIEFGEAAATLVDPPQFNPCMIATGSLAGIVIAEANVPAITEEASDPDGKLDITGGTIDFTRCMDMAGKPDPWPPTEPDANVEAAAGGGRFCRVERRPGSVLKRIATFATATGVNSSRIPAVRWTPLDLTAP